MMNPRARNLSFGTTTLSSSARLSCAAIASIIASLFCLHASAQCNTWGPMSTGLDNNVFAMTVYNGKLIVGGRFHFSGATALNRIAQWNGTSWQPLGSGLAGSEVRALTTFNGNLIIGGTFTAAGGDAGDYI